MQEYGRLILQDLFVTQFLLGAERPDILRGERIPEDAIGHHPTIGQVDIGAELNEDAVTMQLGDKPGPIPVAGDKAKLDFFKEVFSRPAPPQSGRPMP